MVRRARRDDHDEGAEKPVLPRCEGVHVVVEVGSAELDVGIVAMADELVLTTSPTAWG